MRWIWAGFGFIFLGLGAVGMFLPLWPTTIFWILAVFCLSESHPKIRDWIYRRPGIGPMIEGLVERGELSTKAKTAAVLGMGAAGVFSSFLFRDSILVLVILWTILVLVSAFVVSRKPPHTP